MDTFLRWLLGGVLVFSLAACAPGSDDDRDDGTVTGQNEDNDDD